ncbi:MAG: deaminase [Candidatus Nanoarchaeia archaeon]|nr:deaminase [Candidatus Nanoarchaeia archaeon]
MADIIEWDPKIEVLTDKISRNFLADAYAIAWHDSEDPVTKTGAIIINPHLSDFVGAGANHFPAGLNPTEEQKRDRDYKLKHIIHAEPAAIYAAASIKGGTKGAIMYMPWVPCTDCAKAIIDSDIVTFVGHKQMIIKTPERWRESTEYALELLRKCGVGLYMYDGKIGSVKSLFNGEVWEP